MNEFLITTIISVQQVFASSTLKPWALAQKGPPAGPIRGYVVKKKKKKNFLNAWPCLLPCRLGQEDRRYVYPNVEL